MDKKALLPLSLLVLLASPSSAHTMCQASGCTCSVFDDAGEVFLRCANHSLQMLPEMDQTVVGIDASHNIISGLTRFPKLQALQVLDLHFNRISELPASTFSALGSLEVLDLSHNNIADVRPECFEGLEKLSVLNLTDNFIESLQPKVFGSLPSLKKLVLAGNTLKAIDSSWLGSLHKLEHLDLRMLGLRSLSGDVFHELPALKLLELSDNEFEDVPTKALSSAKSLKVLHLEHNPITTLSPESFASVDHIEELHLSAMPKLESVQDGAFVGLMHLRVLDLSNNPVLGSIGAGAFDIDRENKTLEELYLAYANLTSLSFAGFEWCSIRVLDLRGNPWHCNCSLQWISGCHFAPELTTNFVCASPPELSGVSVTELTKGDLHCAQRSAAAAAAAGQEEVHHHGHMTLRLLVVTAGLVTLLMVLAVALVAFRHRDIRDWFQDRKRIGSVYYVKANAAPSSSRSSQV